MVRSKMFPASQKTLFSIVLLLFSCLGVASEKWESDVDKGYINVDYNLYEKTKRAEKLIDEWRGDASSLKDASVLLIEVVKTNPMFAPAYAQLSRVILKNGLIHEGKYKPESMESSEKLLLESLRLEPKYDYALSLMSLIKIYQKDLDSAEKYLVEAEDTGTKDPLLKSRRAYLLYKKGMYKGSMDVALDGFNKYSSQTDIALSYAHKILNASKMLKDSPEDPDYWYRKIIELNPDVAWSYGNYSGYLLFTKMDFDAAIVNAEKAIVIMNYGMARGFLATALYCKWSVLDDEPSTQYEALKYFERATRVDTDFNYLQNRLFNAGFKKKPLMKIYIKLINYQNKRKNAKQDLDAGRLKQHEYDLLISSP